MVIRLQFCTVLTAAILAVAPLVANADDPIKLLQNAVPTGDTNSSPAAPSMQLGTVQRNEDATASPINACFDASDLHSDNAASLDLSVGFSDNGIPAEIVVNDGHGAVGEASRAVLRVALIALVDCAPFDEVANEVTYTVTREGFQPTAKGEPDIVSQLNSTEESLGEAEAETAPETAIVAATVAKLAADTPEEETASAELDREAELLRLFDEISPGSEEIEAALELDRKTRRELQRRLTLLDFSTRGVDGVFGKGTRSAVTAWQESLGIEANGYLSESQIAYLRLQSEPALEKWNKRPKRYYGKKGCLREPNGKIVQGKSVRCDFMSLGESF